MKKKFLTAIIIAAMTVSLVTCGSSATEETTVATETSEVVETTETTETVESSVEAETETTEEVVETETTAAVEETESLAAETKKVAETKTATEKTKENATEKQQAATNGVQPSSDNGGGSTSAAVLSGTTLEENIAYAQSLGYDPYVVTWISDTDSVTYYVVNGHGGGRTMEPDLDRPGYAELVSSVCVYDDANMSVMKDTWHLTGEIPVYPGN